MELTLSSGVYGLRYDWNVPRRLVAQITLLFYLCNFFFKGPPDSPAPALFAAATVTGPLLTPAVLRAVTAQRMDVEDDDAAPPLAPQPRRPVFDALALEDPDRKVLAAWWQRTRPGGPPSPPWSSTT